MFCATLESDDLTLPYIHASARVLSCFCCITNKCVTQILPVPLQDPAVTVTVVVTMSQNWSGHVLDHPKVMNHSEHVLDHPKVMNHSEHVLDHPKVMNHSEHVLEFQQQISLCSWAVCYEALLSWSVNGWSWYKYHVLLVEAVQ